MTIQQLTVQVEILTKEIQLWQMINDLTTEPYKAQYALWKALDEHEYQVNILRNRLLEEIA